MAVVVSDTSPLRCFHLLGRLELLGALFEEVDIPPAVVEELRASKSGDIADAVLGVQVVRVRAPADQAAVANYRLSLDAGESEAIVLAIEIGATAVLMDERRGRALAELAGLTTVGVLGLLVRAKDKKLVERVGPMLDRLRDEGNFFVSDRVRDAILRQAGE